MHRSFPFQLVVPILLTFWGLAIVWAAAGMLAVLFVAASLDLALSVAGRRRLF